MARLTHDQILAEVRAAGYSLIDDSNYTSMQSRIIIECPKGHLIETCLADFRKASFTCPVCDKNIDFINPEGVPAKGDSYRVIAFDQATERFGLSVFDNGKLIFYRLFSFSGDLNARLVKIKRLLDNVVLTAWQPDFVIMEDIQYQQNGILTFKVLAMLLGVTETACAEKDIPFEVVSPNVWRKYAGTNGKNRREEKMLSVAAVREKYNINVGDDVAEAILIGRYGAMMHQKEVKMAFGKKN